MAASTITRSGVTLTNDTGTASSPNGDGTLLNAAWCSTFLDRIDAMFSGAVTFGGVISSEGFGTHSFSAGGSGANLLQVRNTTSGTGNFAELRLGTDYSTSILRLMGFSSAFTSTSANLANGATVQAPESGGLSLVASNASGPIRFYTGGTTEIGRFTASGHLVLTELTTNPGTSDCAADAAVAVYTKADKLVFAYNNGGTMTYITLDLDGSDTTWAHSTSAP